MIRKPKKTAFPNNSNAKKVWTKPYIIKLNISKTNEGDGILADSYSFES